MSEIDALREILSRAHIPFDEFSYGHDPGGEAGLVARIALRLDDLVLNFDRATGALIESVDRLRQVVRTTSREPSNP